MHREYMKQEAMETFHPAATVHRVQGPINSMFYKQGMNTVTLHQKNPN